MKLKVIDREFSICKVPDYSEVDLNREFCFIGKTDEENSLVGILASISTVLAQKNIEIFAVSTFNTDYIFIKSEDLERAAEVLADKGYELI